ncbi:MAG: MarR family winged helix-turn-helix transcriptional regulator [Boseongicola sp.]
MTEFNLEDFLPYQLSVLAQNTSRAFEKEYRARFGIGVAEWRVVAHLSQSSSVSVRDIQSRVAMEKSRVSRAAARLEKSGYVARQPDPKDGRLIALALTTKGHDMIRTLAPIARAFEQQLLEALGDEKTSFRQSVRTLLNTPNGIEKAES